jgi:uncharacterized membrane protein YheB (UPF0754 family)
METYVLYINDKTHAMNQIHPMLENTQTTQWVLVGCPPRLNRHAGKWLTQRALKKFKADWTATNLAEIVELLQQKGHRVMTRVAQGSLIQVTKALKAEFTNTRFVDARKTQAFENLPPVVEQQTHESSPWVIPVSAIAFGTAVSLVAD